MANLTQNSGKKAKGAPRGRPIVAGQILNPGGRPKIPEEVRDFARAYTLPALQKMAFLMENSSNDAIQLAAADKLLERAWGKASQPITDADGKNLVIMIGSTTEKELLDRL